MPERPLPTRSLAVAALAVLALGAVATAAAATPIAQPADDDPHTQSLAPPDNATEPIEDEFSVPAPEPGEKYFEAVADDRRWISYRNPRDEYRDPYLGDGSGKICVTLLNEDGEVVAGESVPNTTVEIPTGETISWHSEADPIEVQLPLTENYERPLDSDQFGTSSDVPQGDGYMDSHCIEFHGPEETAEIDYGEASVEGERADWIDVVGYVQKTSTWETDVDPIAEAEPYEDAGGWTYEPEASHGQAVVVLQLDPPADAYDEVNGSVDGAAPDGNESDAVNQPDGNESDGGDQTDDNESDGNSADGDDDGTGAADAEDESLPGFGVGAALAALALCAAARTRR